MRRLRFVHRIDNEDKRRASECRNAGVETRLSSEAFLFYMPVIMWSLLVGGSFGFLKTCVDKIIHSRVFDFIIELVLCPHEHFKKPREFGI